MLEEGHRKELSIGVVEKEKMGKTALPVQSTGYQNAHLAKKQFNSFKRNIQKGRI